MSKLGEVRQQKMDYNFQILSALKKKVNKALILIMIKKTSTKVSKTIWKYFAKTEIEYIV